MKKLINFSFLCCVNNKKEYSSEEENIKEKELKLVHNNSKENEKDRLERKLCVLREKNHYSSSSIQHFLRLKKTKRNISNEKAKKITNISNAKREFSLILSHEKINTLNNDFYKWGLLHYIENYNKKNNSNFKLNKGSEKKLKNKKNKLNQKSSIFNLKSCSTEFLIEENPYNSTKYKKKQSKIKSYLNSLSKSTSKSKASNVKYNSKLSLNIFSNSYNTNKTKTTKDTSKDLINLSPIIRKVNENENINKNRKFISSSLLLHDDSLECSSFNDFSTELQEIEFKKISSSEKIELIKKLRKKSFQEKDY